MKHSIFLGEELDSQKPTDSLGEKLQAVTKKVCSLCNSETNPYEQVIERISEHTGQPYYTHLSCLSQHSMVKVNDQDNLRQAF